MEPIIPTDFSETERTAFRHAGIYTYPFPLQYFRKKKFFYL